MVYLNGRRILFSPKIHLLEGYEKGRSDGYAQGQEAGYQEGILDANAAMRSIIDRSVTELTEELLSGLTKIGTGAFQSCFELESVEMPETITQIGAMSFQYCTGLTSVRLSSLLQTLPNQSFYGCSSLTEMEIPEEVSLIGSYALVIGTADKSATFTIYRKIPASIYANTFDEGRLEKINVPLRWEGLYQSSTNWSAFADYIEGDSSIVTAITGEELSALGISEIAESMFMDFANLETVEIPEGISKIGNYGFKNCSSLKKVTLPESLTGTNIGKQAFFKCTSLEEVTLPSKITNLRGSCFYGCSSLKSVTLPEGLVLITGTAFYGCKALLEFTVPSTVQTIGENALIIGTAEKPATIIMLPTTPPTIEADTFREDRLERIVVPAGCGDAYKAATNWSIFADYIEEEEV